jgi:hypothetical protein
MFEPTWCEDPESPAVAFTALDARRLARIADGNYTTFNAHYGVPDEEGIVRSIARGLLKGSGL